MCAFVTHVQNELMYILHTFKCTDVLYIICMYIHSTSEDAYIYYVRIHGIYMYIRTSPVASMSALCLSSVLTSPT